MRKKAFLLMLALFIFTGCSDVVTSHYASYQDAVEDRLFIRGWLPDILPKTTANITTKNNLDINASEGDFNIPKNEIEKFVSQLVQIGVNKYSYSKEIYYNEKNFWTNTWIFQIDFETGHVIYEMSKSYRRSG